LFSIWDLNKFYILASLLRGITLIINFKKLTKTCTNMAYKITDIEGIGPAYAEKLEKVGIKTVEKLLELGASKKGREKIAEDSGIDESRILSWVNMADLFRIKGVSSQYAELLHAAGVDSVKELKHRKAENLHAKMVEVNNEKNLVNQTPSVGMVEGFIKQAGELPPVITH
jgi:predicted flap endonuclease-1-like 5' DNA nuclease